MQPSFRHLHQRLCLVAAALMAMLPFLLAHHYNPIPTFFQEWTAAALSFVALTLLLYPREGEPLELPEVALLPIGLLAITVLQGLFLADAVGDRLLMFACYLVWMLMLMILGRALSRRVGLQAVAGLLATALLVGALFQALTAALQMAGLAGMPWVFPATGGFKGNLAQPNNFGDYIWLGVASAVYLRSRGQLGPLSAGFALAILLPCGVLCGSRSVWLYAVGLAAFTVAWTWRRPETRLARNWTLYALAGHALLQTAFSFNLAPAPAEIATSGARLAQSSYDPIRLVLWRIAADTFLDNPWLGAGFGQYTRQFHLRVLDVMPFHLPGLPEHAHNALLHLLAEMGIFAGLLFLGIMARWALPLLRGERTPETWWALALTLVLGIHSNLEYPLWYGNFLGIAALVAGAASRNNRPLELGRTAPYALAAGLSLGGLTLFNLYRDYSLLEDTVNHRVAAASPEERLRNSQAALQELAGAPLLRPYVDLAVAHLMADDADALDTKLKSCDRAQRFSASRSIVFKCAHLLTLAGREDEGREALKRAVASYPDDAIAVREQWKQRSSGEPALARLVADFPPIH